MKADLVKQYILDNTADGADKILDELSTITPDFEGKVEDEEIRKLEDYSFANVSFNTKNGIVNHVFSIYENSLCIITFANDEKIVTKISVDRILRELGD